MEQKTVVVIGPGPSGLSVTKQLAGKGIKVVLVANVEYFCLILSMPRIFNEPVPEWVSRMTAPLKDIVPESVDLIIDDVVDVTESTVKFKTHAEVTFDAVVVATGSIWPAPVLPRFIGDRTLESLTDYYESAVKEVDAASKVVIVGGGAVGLEIAGELAYRYKDDYISGKRSLTLYHSSDNVLDGTFGPSVRQSIKTHLEDNGVRIFLGTKVVDGVILDTKEPVEADLIYYLTGPKPNPPPISVPDVFDDRGHIKVDKHMHAVGKMFALGDVSSFPRKLTQNAKEHSQVVSANVEAYLNGKDLHKEVSTVPKWNQGGISLGPDSGFGQARVPLLGYLTLPKFLVVKVKAKKMLTDHLRDFS